MNRVCINEQCGWEGNESLCLTYKNSDWARLCPQCHENTEIVFTIPEAAIPHLLEMLDPKDVFEEFLYTRRMETIRLKTYGMVITPIVRTETIVVGHVIYWGEHRVTVSKVDGDMSEFLELVIFPLDGCPNTDECLQMWLSVKGDDNG